MGDIMKQRSAGLIILTVVLTFVLVACGNSDKLSKETILADIDAANTRTVLSENNERIAYHVVFFDNSGKEDITVYTYLDQEKYVYAEEVFLNVDKSGEVTYYYSDDQSCGICLFVGENAYNEDLLNWPMAWYEYDPTEKVTEISEEDGLLFIEAEITNEDAIHSLAESVGYEEDEIKKAVAKYVVDAKNYEIQKLEGFLEDSDGTSYPYIKAVKEQKTEEYVLPGDFVAAINNKEKRAVRIIENQGTDKETEYVYRIPIGVECNFVLSSEYEQKLYADAAFTTEFKDNRDHVSDIVAYIRK